MQSAECRVQSAFLRHTLIFCLHACLTTAISQALDQASGKGHMHCPQLTAAALTLVPPPVPNYTAKISLLSHANWMAPPFAKVTCREHWSFHYVAAAMYTATGMLPGRLFFFDQNGRAIAKQRRIGNIANRKKATNICCASVYRGSVVRGLPADFQWGRSDWPTQAVQLTLLPPFQPRWSLGVLPNPEDGCADVPLLVFEGQEWWDGFTAQHKSWVAGKFKLIDRAFIVCPRGKLPVVALHLVGATEPSAYTADAVAHRTGALDSIQYDGFAPRVHFYPSRGQALFAFWISVTSRTGDCALLTKECGLTGGKSNVNCPCPFCDALYGRPPPTHAYPSSTSAHPPHCAYRFIWNRIFGHSAVHGRIRAGAGTGSTGQTGRGEE